MSGLEESDSDERPIGKVIAAVEKKKSTKEKKIRPVRAREEEAEEDVLPLRRKNEKGKDTGTSEAIALSVAASPVERLAAKVAEKSKKLIDDSKKMKEKTESFLAAKKKRKEEIAAAEQSIDEAARKAEFIRRIAEIATELEVEWEESDAEKLPKAERIKKNIKKIREEKKKEKEVAFTKEKLPEKKKKTEVTKAPRVVIRDVDAGRARRTPASPVKRNEKGKEKLVEEPRKEAAKSRKKQYSGLYTEVGFFPEPIELPAFIIQGVDTLCWRQFCESGQVIQPTAVEAFYEGTIHRKAYLVKVEDEVISFEPQEINALFDLPNNAAAEGNRIMSTPTDAELNDALSIIAKPGSEWNTSPKGIQTLAPTCLIAEANLWLYFIKRSLIPTTHDASISRDCAMVIYCIMRGIRLDVGRIIAPQIRGLFFKPRGQLFFPFLVTRLCANAEFMEDAPVRVVNGVLSAQSLRRILKDSPHLLDAANSKKRLTKSQEPSSLQPPQPKKRKLVKKNFEIQASSSEPSEAEETVQLDADAQALKIYTLPINPITEKPSSPPTSSFPSPQIQKEPLHVPTTQ